MIFSLNYLTTPMYIIFSGDTDYVYNVSLSKILLQNRICKRELQHFSN